MVHHLGGNVKKLLFVMAVLALAALACGTATPAPQAPAPQVIVVTATPRPQAAPTAAPAMSGDVAQAEAIIRSHGFTFEGEQTYGQLNCSNARCIHYTNGGSGLSIYAMGNGTIEAILVSLYEDTTDGEYESNAFALVDVLMSVGNIQENEIDCLVEAGPGEDRQCGRFGTTSIINDDGSIFIIVYFPSSENTAG
jgi:hypothetical protein